MKFPLFMLHIFVLAAFADAANAKVLCTVVADVRSGEVLLEEGACRERVTPASTFKIPLAVMGYDSGFLKNANSPKIPFKKGYLEWGGKNWTQATDPVRWLKYSVVWYSQQITRSLGEKRLENYAKAFGFGNADFSGDAGKGNGLERSWIASSLKISPYEQVAFLHKLHRRELPVQPQAMDMTIRIMEYTPLSDDWLVYGKTGSAYPRNADGSFNRARGWGWFVGWAEKNGEAFIFARLAQDEQRMKVSGGTRARLDFLEEWPEIARPFAK